jgi:hypothetical protein
MISFRIPTFLVAGVFLCQGQSGLRLDSITVTDLGGKPQQFRLIGKPTVVLFYSTVCPISNEYNDRMSVLYRTAKDVQWIVVNANQNETAQQIRDHVKAAEFAFPVYMDKESVAADRVGATVTPEAFLFDGHGALRYRGPVDDARNPARVKVSLLREALDAVREGRAVARPEVKAFGCTIKRARKS